jgi:hypothetical protein
MTIKVNSLLLATLALAVTCAQAHPAKSSTVDVRVVNHCDKQIQFHIDNNWGSSYTGDYTLEPAGTVDADGRARNNLSFFFNSNNDEEAYTVSFKNAVCTVDYPKIRDHWFLDANIYDCNTSPRCVLD